MPIVAPAARIVAAVAAARASALGYDTNWMQLPIASVISCTSVLIAASLEEYVCPRMSAQFARTDEIRAQFARTDEILSGGVRLRVYLI